MAIKDLTGQRFGRLKAVSRAPNVTSTSGATDILAYYVESSSRISAQLLSDLK